MIMKWQLLIIIGIWLKFQLYFFQGKSRLIIVWIICQLIVDIQKVAHWLKYTALNKEMLLETELVLPCYVVDKGDPGSPIDTTQLCLSLHFRQKLFNLDKSILRLWACDRHSVNTWVTNCKSYFAFIHIYIYAQFNPFSGMQNQYICIHSLVSIRKSEGRVKIYNVN